MKDNSPFPPQWRKSFPECRKMGIKNENKYTSETAYSDMIAMLFYLMTSSVDTPI